MIPTTDTTEGAEFVQRGSGEGPEARALTCDTLNPADGSVGAEGLFGVQGLVSADCRGSGSRKQV